MRRKRYVIQTASRGERMKIALCRGFPLEFGENVHLGYVNPEIKPGILQTYMVDVPPEWLRQSVLL